MPSQQQMQLQLRAVQLQRRRANTPRRMGCQWRAHPMPQHALVLVLVLVMMGAVLLTKQGLRF
jgi:hypothetical protein